MQRLHYVKAVQGHLLMDQLYAAIPALRGPPEGDPLLVVEFTPSEVWVTVPDNIPSAEVDAVVAAHDPHKVEPRTLEERRAAKATFAAERQIASGP